MSLPATIATGGKWPDNQNSVVGPFLSGANLYTILVDKTNNKLRCYRSTDNGYTWAEVDSANAPFSSTTAGMMTCHVQQASTTLYAFQPLSSTSCEIRQFDCSGDVWGSAITGPTITINANTFYGLRRSDGSYVIFYRGANETVMGQQYARIKIHIRSAAGTWTGPFDVVGSANTPLANTLPGTQVHYRVRGIVLGASDRTLLIYTNSTANSTLQTRVLTSAGAFTTIVGVTGTDVGSVADLTHVGLPVTYTDGSLTKVAIPLVHQTAVSTQLARCDTATAETSGNWSVETVVAKDAEAAGFSNPHMLATDSKKLWLWYMDAHNYRLMHTDDAGAATWRSPIVWKAGQTGGDAVVGGMCVRSITNHLGLVYHDHLGTPTVSQRSHDLDHNIAFSDTGGQNRAFQQIRFGSAVLVVYIRVLLRKVGAPGRAIMDVVTDSAGLPTTTRVGNFQAIAAADIGAGDEWHTFVMPDGGISLSASTDYWLRLYEEFEGNSSTNYYVTRVNSSSVYADGEFATGTSANVATVDVNKDLAFEIYLSTDERLNVYDQVDVYTTKASVGVGSTETLIDLGETPPPYYEIIIDLGDNADPAGTVTVYIDGGWDTGALNPISSDGPNPVQAVNSITLNTPPRYIRITTVVESSASVVGVTGV